MFKAYTYAVVVLLLAGFASPLAAQRNDAATDKVSAYLENIRDKESSLAGFFQMMPKGGDLHHHFSGSVYAEEMYDLARQKNFYVNLQTFVVYPTKPADSIPAVMISEYKGPVNIRENLINLWSVKDYVHIDEASDDHFFNTFGYFGPTIGGSEAELLKTIKQRSIKENIQYIETMFVRPNYDRSNQGIRNFFSQYNLQLLQLQAIRDERQLHDLFATMYQELIQMQFSQYANAHVDFVKKADQDSRLPLSEDSSIVIRYLNYVSRTSQPSDVFAQLMLSFMTVDNQMLLGVNIVAPEDNEISMHDYWLHCQMFNYFKKQFPAARATMHAGELKLGLVKPEDLMWHIRTAVMTAGAKRIGHGVDLVYEQDMPGLLKYMKDSSIAIEINLTSNEFILGIKDDRHPFPIYFNHGVPIVISTDDAGVLRSNHSEQFVLLAKRYKNVSYKDIKNFVYNSITYSFLPAKDKKTLHERLDYKFKLFEQSVFKELIK